MMPEDFSSAYLTLAPVSLLVAAGANVSVPLMDGLTPLHIAAHKGSPEIIELLLSHGAPLHATLPTGATPMYICALNGNLEAIRSFIKCVPHFHRNVHTVFPFTMLRRVSPSPPLEL